MTRCEKIYGDWKVLVQVKFWALYMQMTFFPSHVYELWKEILLIALKG